METLVDVVHAPVFVPEGIRDAVTIHGREVLAGLAVQVQLHRDRLAALVAHAQPDALRGGCHRAEWSRRVLPEFGDGNCFATRQVEARVRVGRVLDQQFLPQNLGRLVVVGLGPGGIRVDCPRLDGNNLAQIELEVFVPAVRAEIAFQRLAFRQA
jgi:hypothetical protein